MPHLKNLFPLLFATALITPQLPAMSAPATPLPYDGVRAPDFPAGFPWLNSKPLSIRALRGKVVLLDFWTYGCINCMHILPDLKKLEEKYPKELVVISVHSAKFDNESDANHVRNAVLRYKIEHPVLVDQKMRVWSEYAVNAWPTLVLVDPTGRVAGQVQGEGNYDVLDATIAQLIQKAKQRGELSETPLSLTLERAKVAPSPLSFPGKVLAQGGKLYIADSGHNRIVVASQQGEVLSVIGGSGAGLKDGSFQAAQFNNPQGLALDGDQLYVADTNNHALRRLDLTKKSVTTLAGNGQQAPYMATGGIGKAALLSSPWDVTKVNDSLIIAMAGNHQIWRYDLKNGHVDVLAGSGAEARKDGSFADAAFAQTSGLTLLGNQLFAADSESSSLRELDLKTSTVKTVAGGDLFDFGDKDGRGDDVRLQHPLGITTDGTNVYFADTYNSKIKQLNPQARQVTTLFGGGLSEPGGLSYDNGAVFIADTNHGVIKRLDLKTKTATVIRFAGLKPPVLKAVALQAEVPVHAQRQVLTAGAGNLIFDAKLPQGFHLNHAAPLKFEAKVSGHGFKLAQSGISGAKFTLPLQIPFQAAAGAKGSIEINGVISYCDTGKGAVCKVQSVKRRVEFEVGNSGTKEIHVEVNLP